jgi:lipopolysaccharide/colanic/teichoic acid biosynthesis glycosyltransferase
METTNHIPLQHRAATMLGYGDPSLLLPAVSEHSRRVTRGLDLVIATIALLLAAPLMLIIVLAVRVTSEGPAIFRQERVGRDGRPFQVLKFRTMVNGTHLRVAEDPHLRAMYERNDFKLPPDHSHITRLGRLLRKTSLDELPQFFNVIRGQMSVVGVRPLLRHELARRSSYDRDLYVLHRPGLTGLWQVEGRSEIGDGHRIELDRSYLEEWTIASNLKILMRTPWAVLHGSGAH